MGGREGEEGGREEGVGKKERALGGAWGSGKGKQNSLQMSHIYNGPIFLHSLICAAENPATNKPLSPNLYIELPRASSEFKKIFIYFRH